MVKSKQVKKNVNKELEKKLSPPVVKILKEMCKRVKCDYHSFNLNQPDWFLKYEWTEKEQDDFKKWLINYLRTNKQVSKHFGTLIQNKKVAEDSASWFLLDYGWRFKNE